MQTRRLDQMLSRYGYCSRSEARIWLRANRVTVNGEVAKAPDQKATPESVRIDGNPIECPDGLLALLNKPAGYVCSRDAREGPSIYELLPKQWSCRNPPVTSVGRLDKDTTGVLLVTDEGALVQKWASPRGHVPKTYEVTVEPQFDPALIDTFASGRLQLKGEDRPCLPARLVIISPREARVELTEGRYHQVKRMFASQGYQVLRLHRSKFGEFHVDDLEPGQWRLLPIAHYLPFRSAK